MFDTHKVEIEWGGRPLTLETGKVARQADDVADDLAMHQQWLVERCARIDAALTDLYRQARHLAAFYANTGD